MPSLSTYEEKGSAYFHGKTYREDIAAGNEAMELFLRPIRRLRRRPRIIFLRGNHEDRIRRAAHRDPTLRGTLTYDDLNTGGLECHDFLRPVEIDGILYCHYFVNPQSLKKNVLCGTIDNRLNKLKCSFTMGHQQSLLYGIQDTVGGRRLHGLVAGAFHQHDEDYAGPQGSGFWRGMVVKNEVYRGMYDPCFVSLDYLLRNYR